MEWYKFLQGLFNDLFMFLVATAVAGFWWIVRSIFTNKKQIELLQQSLETENKLRQLQLENDKDRMDRMASAIHELNQTQKSLAPIVQDQTQFLREIRDNFQKG